MNQNTIGMISLMILLALVFNISCNSEIEYKNFNSKPVSHEIWDNLLEKHVSVDGNVNYKGFLNDRAELKKYLDLLGSSHPDNSWSKEEQMAYWINAYNAFTIELILRNYPVKSIKDIGIISPWHIGFIEIQGEKYDLNDIEHNILRKKFNDPRIHFAIVCASYSCPKLLNEAFIASGLNAQLNEQARQFINDPSRNKISATHIKISKIFDWFTKDFTDNGSLVDYLNKYSSTRIDSKAKVSYLQYNWSLNSLPR